MLENNLIKKEYSKEDILEIFYNIMKNEPEKMEYFDNFWKANNTEIISYEKRGSNLILYGNSSEIPSTVFMFILGKKPITYICDLERRELYLCEKNIVKEIKNEKLTSRILKNSINNMNFTLTPEDQNFEDIQDLYYKIHGVYGVMGLIFDNKDNRKRSDLS